MRIRNIDSKLASILARARRDVRTTKFDTRVRHNAIEYVANTERRKRVPVHEFTNNLLERADIGSHTYRDATRIEQITYAEPATPSVNDTYASILLRKEIRPVNNSTLRKDTRREAIAKYDHIT